jgi:hypothetical protein
MFRLGFARIGVVALVALSAGVAAPGAAAPSAARPAGGTSFSVEYRNATTSGTYTVTRGGLSQRLDYAGSVGVSHAQECYLARLIIYYDLTWRFRDLATHCGTGSTAFSGQATGPWPLGGGFAIQTCLLVDKTIEECSAAEQLR